MLNRYKKKHVWFAGAGAAVTLGATVSALTLSGNLMHLPIVGSWLATSHSSNPGDPSQAQNSSVLSLAMLPPADRDAKLEKLVNGDSSDRDRARYLLAADLIQQDHGGKALPLLDGLDSSYPAIAPYVLAKRAQAYTATGNNAKAAETWKALIQQFPKDPATAEALYALGKTNPQYWDQALQQFPSHPRSIEIALARLEKKADQPQLLMHIARYGIYSPSILNVLNRLKAEYATKLTSADWEAIGFAYWEAGYYGSAGVAYDKAPNTPLNLYRTGRGAQLGERYRDATVAYQQLIQAYPTAKETGQALLKIAEVVEKPQEAIPYLDRAMQQFPDQAAEAMSLKADILQGLGSPDTALQLQQAVLKQHSSSETAAKLRWNQAEANFKKGDVKAAWEWARQLAQENPESELAAQASFWVGKWAMQLERQADAQQSFEYVLSRYPESYYAWRSASLLGWQVGDFTTVRSQVPQIRKPTQQAIPLVGSTMLKELYLLGQHEDAWTRWQTEFTNRLHPTVAEQFTDGLMRLGINNNLDGIFMLSSLSFREPQAEKADYKMIRQQAGYWQSLYPFPFADAIERSAQERQLNPLLVTALIRQESRFEPAIESAVGATGLMQLMPETADWVSKQVKLKDYKLSNPIDNIKMGTWYLDYTHHEYDNNSLFAVASYNAGPGSVSDWISKYGFSDPDKFVEQIPYPETRGYVESVFGNYWNYLRLYNPEVAKKLATYSQEQAKLIDPTGK